MSATAARALLPLLPLALPLDAAGSEVVHVEASLEPEGELLGARFTDLDDDGVLELVLVVRNAEGGRELRLHAIRDGVLGATPERTVHVLPDAIAYGFADVRPEPGRELFFLARGGAWSLSLEREGYRGNLERLAELELIYDVPDPEDLPAWEYVLPAAPGSGGRERILLPGAAGYVLWAPPEARATEAGYEEASYRPVADIPRGVSVSGAPHPGRSEVAIGAGGIRIDGAVSASELPSLFVPLETSEDHAGGRTFLSSERSYDAPALVDVDGDGALDLVALEGDTLAIRLGRSGPGVEPDRVEPLPDYLDTGDRKSRELQLVDLDGDGDLDLLARLDEDREGLGDDTVDLLCLRNDGARLLPDQPTQVLRFESATLRVEVTDVDGDGRPDLAVRKLTLPSLLDTVTGIEFELTYLVYRGQAGERPFERKPLLKQTETYDETTVEGVIKNREWRMDCDGDGLADVVEVDLRGRITIRRLVHEKSFFGGETWSLEPTPWRRFETPGDVGRLEVRDLNGDGLGDVISRGEKALTVVLSRVRGGAR